MSQNFVRPQSPVDSEASQGRNNPENTPAVAQTDHSLVQNDHLNAETLSLASEDLGHSHVEAVRLDTPESPDRRTTVINTAMSGIVRKSPPRHLTLGPVDTDERDAKVTTENSNLNKALPKSPVSASLGAYFGWANTPSSTTEFSDKEYSPLPSPISLRRQTTIGTDSDEFLRSAKGSHYANVNYLQTPPSSTTSAVQIEEMEDELKAISAELAASIRREMDLEDLVDRMQDQINNAQIPGRRTSDYYSDSGYSSARFSEFDHAKEEVSQIQRRAEQEKAKITLELTDKLQEERTRRKELDQQIEVLSRKASQIDVAQLESQGASERIKELEATCEDLRRKLSEERQVKDNFEDLLAALKGELQDAADERDNLRDEVIPQLRKRVEGLEAEAAENARLAYDASKLQQELQSLKVENTELSKTQQELQLLKSERTEIDRLQQELQSLRSENSELSNIQHELQLLRSENSALKQTSSPRMSVGLSRSASVAGSSYKKGPSRPQSLARSNTVKQSEPREVLADRLKDVEAQRDALHSALRSLLERQEFQNRENAKRIRQLELERDRLLSASPKKAGYEKEVSSLRDEISVLRRRAEEAIEQKWQVEKGLGGLKMDLDRAEEEIKSLRSLLKEKDILIPETLVRSSYSSDEDASPVTSASLEKAYKDLQAAYAEALERIKALEAHAGSDEKTQLAIQRLEQSLFAAISERDIAREEADSYRSRVESFYESEKQHLDIESDLAQQLEDSARRVGELAQQVRAQLAANAALRARLAETVARGEADQRVSTERIASLQKRLRILEEQVVAAQTSAEERVGRHEDELAELKEAHSFQLQRLRDAAGGLRSPRAFPPKSPLSPMFSIRGTENGRSARMSSPFLSPHPGGRPGLRRSSSSTIDGASGSMAEQVDTLKGRVSELEGALASADSEMQEVVGRMNTAQIEVMTLQEQREEAVRETRRLQRIIEEERIRVFEERFRMITTEVR